MMTRTADSNTGAVGATAEDVVVDLVVVLVDEAVDLVDVIFVTNNENVKSVGGADVGSELTEGAGFVEDPGDELVGGGDEPVKDVEGELVDDETVGGGDETVGGGEEAVDSTDETVGGGDEAVDGRDETVGGGDETVGGGEESVKDVEVELVDDDASVGLAAACMLFPFLRGKNQLSE